MESLGYLLLYFLRGRLPWQGLKVEPNEDRNTAIMQRKENIGVDELCDQVPQEFGTYIQHVRALGFEDKPKYSYLRTLFRNLFIRSGFEYDNVFDWTAKRYAEQQGT